MMNLWKIFSDDSICRVAIDGEVTIYSVAEVKAGLAALLPAPGTLEIDLSGVTEMDTAGLQLLLMAKRLDGPNVRFVNHSDAVLAQLGLTNLQAAVGEAVN
jgi:anti-sigma B factor antagonist